MADEEAQDERPHLRIFPDKSGAKWAYFFQDQNTIECYRESVAMLRNNGVATNVKELYSPYSSLVRMTIDGCDVMFEYDGIEGISFHCVNEADNASLDRVAGAIQAALSPLL